MKASEKTITCYKCKQEGHYKNKCLLWQKNKQSNAFSAVFLDGKYNKNEWYIDSGASAHMSANKHWINKAHYSPSLSEIVIANEMKVPVECSGEVEITTDCNYNITVMNVLCVPSLTTNLLSVSELIKNGNSVNFETNHCYIRNMKNEIVATAELTNGVYKLKLNVAADCLLASSPAASAELWHRRLAHLNICDLNKIKNRIVDGMSYVTAGNIDKTSCVVKKADAITISSGGT